MKDGIQLSLDEVIGKEIDRLKYLDNQTEEKSKTIGNLTGLYKIRIEEAKIEQARRERVSELELRRAQLKSQSWDRFINVGVQVGLAIGGWIAYDIWNRRGLKFEETGTITSPWTRNLLSRMLPKK